MINEFIKGNSLDKYLHKNNYQYLTFEIKLIIIKQMFNLLAKTYSKNILHLDIKPPNFILADNL